jgi:hypothetical protein
MRNSPGRISKWLDMLLDAAVVLAAAATLLFAVALLLVGLAAVVRQLVEADRQAALRRCVSSYSKLHPQWPLSDKWAACRL